MVLVIVLCDEPTSSYKAGIVLMVGVRGRKEVLLNMVNVQL